jgi:hypothetical protein
MSVQVRFLSECGGPSGQRLGCRDVASFKARRTVSAKRSSVSPRSSMLASNAEQAVKMASSLQPSGVSVPGELLA